MAATIDSILDDLSDYADYEEVGSVSRAKTFITAAMRFLQQAQRQSDQGSSMEYDAESVRQQMSHARAYVKSNATVSSSGASSVRFLTAAEGFRR